MSALFHVCPVLLLPPPQEDRRRLQAELAAAAGERVAASAVRAGEPSRTGRCASLFFQRRGASITGGCG